MQRLESVFRHEHVQGPELMRMRMHMPMHVLMGMPTHMQTDRPLRAVIAGSGDPGSWHPAGEACDTGDKQGTGRGIDKKANEPSHGNLH
jgi:hypothetical protein